MKLIINDSSETPTFLEALHELADGAHTLSVAVSYIQISGWKLFIGKMSRLRHQKMRIVCTDQFGITQPAAIRAAQVAGVQVRNFSGSGVFHPKVYIAQDENLRATKYLIGSANLSSVALTTSVEAGMLGSASEHSQTLLPWFDNLFRQTEEFTPEKLLEMTENWRRAATQRIRLRLRARREIEVVQQLPAAVSEDIESLDDIFSTLQVPIGLLCFDYAGNNIRNISQARTVLTKNHTQWSDKQRSELHLLGFANGGQLTSVGVDAAAAPSEEEFAKIWLRWLQSTPDTLLNAINPRLRLAKRVFAQFWKLQSEVRDFFLEYAINPNEDTKRLLQTIELLCNADDVVQELTLEEIKGISRLLRDQSALPPATKSEILDYFGNKGVRSWSKGDRKTLPNAWNEVSN